MHHQRAKTHCPQGHPYDDENTRWYRNRRACRTCQKARDTSPQRRAWYAENRERLNAESRQRLSENPDARQKNLANARRWRYGVTQERYDEMLAQQNGVCAICLQPETRLGRSGEVKSLAVDHDHETGAVRKLLCMACNQALGFLRDSADLARRAADYLDAHEVTNADQ